MNSFHKTVIFSLTKKDISNSLVLRYGTEINCSMSQSPLYIYSRSAPVTTDQNNNITPKPLLKSIMYISRQSTRISTTSRLVECNLSTTREQLSSSVLGCKAITQLTVAFKS